MKAHNVTMFVAACSQLMSCLFRYGPLHREMAAKLEQMDSVLRSVVDNLDLDDLLLVMGDHGM